MCLCVCVCVCPVEMQYHCSLFPSKEGEYPCGSAPKNVPMFYLLSGFGEGGDVERPLFRSFVYVRSGSRVLGALGSLGMLGFISSYVVWTVYTSDLRLYSLMGLDLTNCCHVK